MAETIKSSTRTTSRPRSFSGVRSQSLLFNSIITILLAAGAAVIMIPFFYLISTSVKDRDKMRQSPPPMIPMAATTVEINGQNEPLYRVTVNGQQSDMALIKNRPGGKGLFVDPENPEQTYE